MSTATIPVRENPSVANLQEVARELEIVREKQGGMLTPEGVVEFAKANKRCELHKHFTWDDSEAARKWRVEEARSLIIRVKVILPQSDEPLRQYVSLSTDRKLGDGYRALTDVLSNPGRLAVLMEDALRELESVKRRYEHLAALQPVWTAMAVVAGSKAKRK